MDDARGGTLLIDEAYQLMPVDSDIDTGIEALEATMDTNEGGEKAQHQTVQLTSSPDIPVQ